MTDFRRKRGNGLWRLELTESEEDELADLEREAADLDKRRQYLTALIYRIQNRATQRRRARK